MKNQCNKRCSFLNFRYVLKSCFPQISQEFSSISNLLNVYHIPKATHDSWQINWPQKKRKCEWLHYYCLVHLFGKRMKKKKVLDDKGICCFFFVQTWEFCRSSKPLVVVDIQCAGNKKVVTFQFHIMTKVRTNKEF